MTNSLSRKKMISSHVLARIMVFGFLMFLLPLGAFAQTPPPPPPNEKPVANPDSALVAKNSVDNIIDVASNDSDPEGSLDPLSVAPVNASTAAGGTVSSTGEGTLKYTPALDYAGIDSFTYTICDTASPALCSNPATVTIEVKLMASVNVIPKKLNIKKRGVIPVVIRSTEELDASTIDPETITLEGVPPFRWNFARGSKRLNLKFKAQDIVQAIGDVEYGEKVTLELIGNLFPPEGALEGELGEEFIGQDDVLIIGVPKHPHP